jgi:hypothetical protein
LSVPVSLFIIALFLLTRVQWVTEASDGYRDHLNDFFSKWDTIGPI